MTSSFPIPPAARSRGLIAPAIVATILLVSMAIPSLPPSSARAEAPTRVYYSDLTRDAVPDPAFADSRYKTRRDVLPGVVGPETWVEHFIREGTVIETLTYNDLTYGVVIKKRDGTAQYWAVNDDMKTYALSGGESPAGWTIKNPPSYDQIITKVKQLNNAKRFDDVITYITEVTRDSGVETAEIYFFRGIAYDQIEEFAYAKSDYKKAISIEPANADAYFNLGTIYSIEGDHAQAITCFERYLELYPTDPRAEEIRKYIKSYK